MRMPALVLLTPLLLAGQPAPRPAATPTRPEDLGVVSGRVQNASTGEPVRRATVVLMRAEATPGQPPIAYTASSNNEGAFTMKDLEPGRYRLTVQRNGFVNYTYGARGPSRSGTTVTLARQQHLSDLTLKLTPHAIITGRIVDEEGEALPNVQVSLQGYRYLQGRRQLLPAGGAASTNDLGEFRIFGVAPGKYFLNATFFGDPRPNFAVDRSAAPGAEESYTATYYPGTIDPAGAAPLDIPAGGQLRGIDMVLKKIHTVHIKGHVTHTITGRLNLSVIAVPRNNGGFVPALRSTAVDPAGNFVIRNVPPGSYVVTAILSDGSSSHMGRTPVDVGASGVEGVNVTLSPGIAIKGRIRSDPDAPPVDLSAVRVSLQPRESVMMSRGVAPAKPDEQGNFELKEAAADRYNLIVMGLSGDAFVKSVRADQADVLSSGLDLSSGAPPAPLDIVVSPRGAMVSGTVQNEKTNSPAPSTMVVLMPQEKERREQSGFTHIATTDQQGAFTMTGIPPGEYRLYAWEDIEPGAWLDPDYMKPFEGKGESVTIREGDKKSVPLKLIPAESQQ